MVLVFCIVPIKNTTSYITSLSKTCENTFTKESKAKPDVSEKVETPSKTDDDTKMESYVTVMIISLAIYIIVLKKIKRRIENENQ